MEQNAQPAEGQARPEIRTRPRRNSRRKVLTTGLGVAAATVGVGAVLEMGSGTASAESIKPESIKPGVFASNVAGTPAVSATGTNGADGVDASSDSGTGVSATSMSSTGLFAKSSSGLAGHFVGNVQMDNNLTVASALSTGTLSSGAGALASSTAGTPAVKATGTSGADGVDASSDSGTAIFAQTGGNFAIHAIGSGGSNVALFADGGTGRGVFAQSGGFIAIEGQNTSTISGTSGVAGFGTKADGVSGQSTDGHGVSGSSTNVAGVIGGSTNGTGVQGNGAPGVFGLSTGTGINDIGVSGQSTNGTGVHGFSTNGTGVFGDSSTSGTGVFGSSSSGNGVLGQSNPGNGVLGQSTTGNGVHGQSFGTGDGVFGESKSGIGMHAVGGGASPGTLPSGIPATAVFAEGGPNPGIVATSTISTAVVGESSSGGGISGVSNSGIGVFGVSNSGPGVSAISGSGSGVFGESSSENGVFGQSDSTSVFVAGVKGVNTNGTVSGLAGLFDGNVQVNGNFSVSGTKAFVQAHPTDPSREIVYVALEGGEAGTYVRGTGQLQSGKAVLALPEHFGLVTATEGLTIQLTSRGEWLQLYLVELDPTQAVVREAQGKSGAFDYLIHGVRRGYEQHEVIRTKR